MVLAKDRGNSRRRRANWLCVLSCGLACLTGCASWPGQRHALAPTGGPALAASSRPQPQPDPYAAWLQGQRTPRQAEAAPGSIQLADRGAPGTRPAAPDAVAVQLQPPEGLRDVSRTRVANRDSGVPGGVLASGGGESRPAPAPSRAPAVPRPGTLLADLPAPDLVPIPSVDDRVAGPAPVSTSVAADLSTMRGLVEASRTRLTALQSYQTRLERQERVGNQLQQPEQVVLSIRRTPRAVRIEWPDGPTKGREVVYIAGGPMHIKMPNNPLMPRMSMPPDSPLALRNSRHPISEAGLEILVEQLDQSLARHEAGQGGAEQMRYDGLVAPGPGEPPAHKLIRVTAAGETWVVYIDSSTQLPYWVEGSGADGSLLERYVFRDVRPDPVELADNSAFDPDARWGTPRGLFSRLASSAGTSEPAADRAPVRQ